jgi:hypothetical protein
MSCDHLDRQDREDNTPGNGNGTARDMEEPHQKPTEGEKYEGSDDRYSNHPPAYGALRLGIKVLGLFEKWNERNLRPHANEQKQKKLAHQRDIDNRKIHRRRSLEAGLPPRITLVPSPLNRIICRI